MRAEKGYIVAGLFVVSEIFGCNAAKFYLQSQHESDLTIKPAATSEVKKSDSLTVQTVNPKDLAVINLGVAGILFSAGTLFVIEEQRKLKRPTPPTGQN
jgi:hypothetical protein